ncbi:MAG: RluA family pseudouridine synthase [Clostridiales bacterium]|nr:RluA family pseudouridine synthase [Clostridiales bacterium]
MDRVEKYVVEENYDGLRIDSVLSEIEEDLSRSYLQKLIKDGLVLVGEKPVKPNYKVSKDECITYTVPTPVDLNIEAEDIPLEIVYEDDDIIIVNKGKGMVVHPAAGHYSGTLVNGLLYHCKDSLSGINGVLRPGIVHRIDMNTTGILVVCKNDNAHQCIADQLKVHSITRKYDAICYQAFKDSEGTVDAPLGRHPVDRKKMSINQKNGKRAVTHYKVLENFGTKYAHIECSLETGRTHQIRVHMASIHHPLLGDDVYGYAKDPFKLQGQALHARVLGFIHPSTKEYVEFEAPLPEYFTTLMNKLRCLN